jgi:cytidylate kinase
MDDKKIIINVGRQLGSGGRVIASMLAKDFGCKFYDKELLNLAAKESGFCETFFEQNDEQKGFLKSFFYAHMPFLSGSSFYSNKLSQESLFQFQSDAIRKAADEGSCVFVGRCADYVLRDYENTASVFITADLDERVERVAKRHGCGKETAMKIITDRESERSTYYNYYTGKKWGYSASYDLCINSSILGMERTEELIKEFIKNKLGL